MRRTAGFGGMGDRSMTEAEQVSHGAEITRALKRVLNFGPSRPSGDMVIYPCTWDGVECTLRHFRGNWDFQADGDLGPRSIFTVPHRDQTARLTPRNALRWFQARVKEMRMGSLRRRTIRLAHQNPNLRTPLLHILMAKEHASPEALKQYLKDHPNADPKNHTVGGGGDGKGSGGALGKLKGLGAKAMKALKAAPKEVQKFFSDPAARKEALGKAADALKKAPGKAAHAALHAAQHTAEEYKHAGGALKALASGKKPSKEEKKALVSVGIAVGVAALSAATGGIGAFAGTLGKNTLKHMALAAVNPLAGDAFTLYEGGHLAEGLAHVFASDQHRTAEDKQDAAMKAYAEMVVKAVTKQLEAGLDAKQLKQVLEG